MNWLDQLESELAQRITDKVIPQAHQKPPESDDWEAWVLATGRGGGKTFAAMFWLAEQARSTPGLRVRVIAPTFADGVASCVEGPNGLLRFATTAKWAPSAAGGARVEFNNGSKVWIIGTPTPRDVDRLRALTNIHCLVAGTEIATERGPVPIEAVTTDDRVWTRNGWRRVLWSGCTGHRSDIYRLRTDEGRTLVGTSDHRVWTGRGWVPLALLKNGDILSGCRPSTASGSTSGQTPAISTTARGGSCTGLCGSITTARSTTGCTCTTSMVTAPTTGLTTSWRCRLKNIIDSMRNALRARKSERPLPSDGNSGGVSTKVRRLSASFAARGSITGTLRRPVSGSVLLGASSGTDKRRGSGQSSLTPCVSYAGQSFEPGTTSLQERPPSPATDHVQRSTPIAVERPVPVYDLTVEGEHEFYANEILVHNCDIFEEAAANPQLQEAWDQAKLSRRGIGIKTRWVATTTPRPLKIMRQWQADPDVHYVRAPSSANAHADKTWLASLDKIYKGTRLYRQEVLGEIVDDVDGALWTLADLERSEVNRTDVDLHKIVVGVDPPATVGTCGIVVAGLDEGGHLYVLADYSITDATPNRWARQVYRASNDYGGAAVVAEINQGGRMVTSVLKSAAEAGETPPPITTVHAAKGKQTRAEPVALRWEAEEQTAHMCPDPSDETRNLAKLYDQLTGWVPGEGDSPDRLDAMVWAGTHLRQSTFPSAVVATQVASSRLPGW